MITIIISIEAMGKQCNGKRQAQLEKQADAADMSALFCYIDFWSVDVIFVETVQNGY